MSRKGQNRDDPQTRERLALLGLAADRTEPAEPCPDDEHFAALLEAEPGSAGHRPFFEHLSRCEPCFQKWLALSEALGKRLEEGAKSASRRRRRRLYGVAGSACGLALGVMLYLGIDYRPLKYNAADRQRGDQSSEVPTIRQPATSPAPGNALGPDETISARQPSGPLVSEPVPSVGKNRAKSELFDIEEEQGRAVGSSARYGQLSENKMDDLSSSPVGDTALSALPELADERLPDSAIEGKKILTTGRETVDPDDEDSVRRPAAFIDFASSVDDLCTAHTQGTLYKDAEVWGPIIEKGQDLLDSEVMGERKIREFVAETIRLLGKESINDKEWGALCTGTSSLMPGKSGSAP